LSTTVLQGSVATRVNYGKIFIAFLLQIYCWVWR